MRSTFSEKGSPLRIAVVGAQPDYLVKLRGQLLRDLVHDGHAVTAVGTHEDHETSRVLQSWGVDYAVVPLSRTGLNPARDLASLRAFSRFFSRLKPDVMLVYTTKSIVWASLGAFLAGVPRRYAMVAGRGYALVRQRGFRATTLRLATKLLMATALHTLSGVIFQNDDDLDLFRRARLVPRRMPMTRVFGSGVELDRFPALPLPQPPITFLLVARLLQSKGIAEFVEAARRVRAAVPGTRFIVVGDSDPGPNAIPPAQIENWKREGIVEFAGYAADVRPFLAKCHVFVLPSTGEGVPRSILEALATGRPVITADTPGCRDTVAENRNGALVPFADPEALATAMLRYADGTEDLAAAGAESRKLAEERFDARSVSRAIRRAMKLVEHA